MLRPLLILLLVSLSAIAQPQRHAMLSQFTPLRVFDFTRGSMPTGLSFVRNSIATRYNASGYVESVDANVPRITYNPVTGACLGLLLEESRTNQFTNSNDFLDWTMNHVTMTGNAGIAPDGSNTAVKMSENNNTEYHYLSRNVSYNSSNTYTYSAYVKAGTRSVVSLQMEFSGSGYAGGNVDLTNGSVSYTSGNASASQIAVTPIKNGWYRIAFTSYNNGNGGERVVLTVRQSPGQDAQYQGDGSYIYVWGAQFEQGAFVTSYIPTGGSSVPRAADTYSLATTGWYNPAEGAFLCRFSTDVAGIDLRPLIVWDGSNNNRFTIQRNTSNQLGGFGVSGGTTITLGTLPGQSTGSLNVAFAYRGTDYRLAANNTLLAVPSNTVSAPAVTTMTNQASGRLILQKLIYYPHRLPSTYLQTLTQ